MSGYCKYCGRLFDNSEMIMITSASKQGDVWMRNYWIGCNSCADNRGLRNDPNK